MDTIMVIPGADAQISIIKRMKENKKKQCFILGLLITIQVLMLVYVGCQKQEYHIDEIYSYILSNSKDTDRISHADWMWNNWISGDSFNEFITVQNGEEFSYATVYKNNALDCHPPIFYWILHTVCSFAPDCFSKWLGLGMNIAFFVVAAVLIYLISNELITSNKWKMLPVIMWGFSKFAVDTCTFIRMYMLLTVFALGFAYLHIRMFKYGVTKVRLFLVWVLIYLGSMTHYYSVVLSFWGVLFFAVYLLKNKKIKIMFAYGIGSCCSIIVLLITYPYVITQATGSSTNNIGNEVARNLFNIKLWIQMTKQLLISLVSNISYYWLISVAVAFAAMLALIVLLIVNKRRKIKEDRSKYKEVIWLTSAIIMTFLSISFIGGEYVYLRYIYFIIPLVYIVVVVIFARFFRTLASLSNVAIVTCIAFAVLNAGYGTFNNYSSYLFQDTAAIDKSLSEYSDKPLIVIVDKIGVAVPTGNLTKFKMFDRIYMAEAEKVLNDNLVKKTFQREECVVYIATDTYWLNGFDADEILEKALAGGEAEYAYIADGNLGKFYHIYTLDSREQ